MTMTTALIGVFFISGSLQGHVSLVGDLSDDAKGYALRVMLFAGGICMALPGEGLLGLDRWVLNGIGIALAALPVLSARARGSRAATTAPQL